MTGMCGFCQFNACAPGEDLCRDCLDLRAEQRRRRIQLVEEQKSHWAPHQGCTASAPCDECASVFFPGDAA